MSLLFLQIEPDGRSLKTILRSFGTYYDNGTIPFTLDEWYQIVFTFDGTSFKTYLMVVVATSSLTRLIDPNDGELGVRTADGNNLFKGWIDDVRFYGVPLHSKEVEESYSEGAGDLKVTWFFTVNRATSTMPVSVSLRI